MSEKFVRWPQMAVVVNVLNKTFNEDFYADKCLELEFKKNKKLGANDRRVIAETTYEIVRWWRKIHAFLNWDWKTKKNEDEIWFLVLTWLNWKGFEKPNWQIIEKFNKQKLDIREDVKLLPQEKYSLSDEMYFQGLKELGEEKWHRYLEILNEQAPVFLRVNLLKITTEDLIKLLREEDVEVEKVPEAHQCLKLTKRKNVFITECFKNGFFEVQDLGSQEISNFVKVQAGHRVVDACAGAGGKSLSLASIMKNKGKIIALDIHQWKLNELAKRSRRAGVDIIEIRCIDDKKVLKRLNESADKVLLDVPCSGMGVLKRNPDSKWKFSLERFSEIRNLQSQILFEYSSMVKKGGELIYSTCSVLPSENENQIKKFMDIHSDNWSLIEEKLIDPVKNSNDGFYMAKLKRL